MPKAESVAACSFMVCVFGLSLLRPTVPDLNFIRAESNECASRPSAIRGWPQFVSKVKARDTR
jgi:hypothetical protein